MLSFLLNQYNDAPPKRRRGKKRKRQESFNEDEGEISDENEKTNDFNPNNFEEIADQLKIWKTETDKSEILYNHKK